VRRAPVRLGRTVRQHRHRPLAARPHRAVLEQHNANAWMWLHTAGRDRVWVATTTVSARSTLLPQQDRRRRRLRHLRREEPAYIWKNYMTNYLQGSRSSVLVLQGHRRQGQLQRAHHSTTPTNTTTTGSNTTTSTTDPGDTTTRTHRTTTSTCVDFRACRAVSGHTTSTRPRRRSGPEAAAKQLLRHDGV